MHPPETGSAVGHGPGMRRRDLLAALAGGATLAAGAGRVLAAPAAPRNIVDVHAHMPTELRAPGAAGGGGAGGLAAWTIDKHLAGMDEAGIAVSILSLTQPGIVQKGDEGRGLIRKSNEAGARFAVDHPGRIGFFAYIEPTDIEGSLAEIAYSFDLLKTRGVAVFTNYEGALLGDPKFDPIWDELNRRKAIVHVHPTLNPCCRNAVPGVGDGTIEFATETTRALARYVYSGAAHKYPDVKMIWSHSAGSMPSMIYRFDGADRNPATKQAAPDGFRGALSRMFYDVALAASPAQTAGLRNVVPASQLLFGTDYPFATMKEYVAELEGSKIFTRAELDGLYRGNVARALPSLIA